MVNSINATLNSDTEYNKFASVGPQNDKTLRAKMPSNIRNYNHYRKLKIILRYQFINSILFLRSFKLTIFIKLGLIKTQPIRSHIHQYPNQ